MKCIDVQSLMEQYITGELDHREFDKVESHIQKCPNCRQEYEDLTNIIGMLTDAKDELELKPQEKEELKFMFAVDKRRSGVARWFQYGSWVAVLVLAAFIGTMFMSPAAAAKILPDFPLVREMLQLKADNADLKGKLEVYSQKDNGLDEVQEITDQEKFEVQNTVLSFVKAQYEGDRQKMLALATEDFAIMMQNDPGLVPTYDQTTSLSFIIVTNTVKMDNQYLTFVRLEDSRTDSQYQENFYIQRVGDKFKINMVEMDA
ncbi:zf-HC2 domain-containing protein [Metallumcola ferriviriculae]|uniref:Anti-sigma-W factor RsiW n=1 Tax=Metallumcola ferriviriculae TaxID=3039180 RepID=A0AAU0UKB7_9FIRM|nr:zf-HC2 domain-containing protein [Desulfitibacteraceae bacterium MK1]